MMMLHKLLNELPTVVNDIFDLLQLVVVRLTLLALALMGAYDLLSRHQLG